MLSHPRTYHFFNDVQTVKTTNFHSTFQLHDLFSFTFVKCSNIELNFHFFLWWKNYVPCFIFENFTLCNNSVHWIVQSRVHNAMSSFFILLFHVSIIFIIFFMNMMIFYFYICANVSMISIYNQIWKLVKHAKLQSMIEMIIIS